MNSVCWFCLRDLEIYDGVYLCHPCHNIFGDVNSPFYHPTLLMQETWKEAMSDPNATMWLRQRLENK